MRLLFRTFMTLLLLGTAAGVAYILLLFTKDVAVDLPQKPLSQVAIDRKLAKEAASWKNLHFELVDPAQAPKPLKDVVEAGYRIMLHTHELLPQFAGDKLDCANCHFAGGITTGGVGGGIPLAGVAAEYPKYNETTRSIEDLPTRINNCFMNSMNGRPLPLESKEMLALVTYLHWISARYPIYGKAPWLGVKPIKALQAPDAARGAAFYATLCADCHGTKGEGGNASKEHPGTAIPPLWGASSFNANAGMNTQAILASFIYHNMPYEEPHLSAADAQDIAAFVLSQPRPPRKKQ